MRRLTVSAFSVAAIVGIAAVAGGEPLRVAALAQLRAVAEPLFERGPATEPRFDRFYAAMVEELPIQTRAERALELAINRFDGASGYVIANAQQWRGQIGLGERLNTLVTAAINSPLIEVRMAGFELYLAQYDLDKSADEVGRLIERLEADPEHAGPWALWSMAVIGARGVDRERVLDELLFATGHPLVMVRRWAVDALARFGGVEVIDPLLAIAVEDPSAVVRERAFCGLAQSGTLHLAERYEALPGLLAIAADPGFDQQTRDWSFQALREITGLYELPEQAQPWRERLIDLELL